MNIIMNTICEYYLYYNNLLVDITLIINIVKFTATVEVQVNTIYQDCKTANCRRGSKEKKNDNEWINVLTGGITVEKALMIEISRNKLKGT